MISRAWKATVSWGCNRNGRPSSAVFALACMSPPPPDIVSDAIAPDRPTTDGAPPPSTTNSATPQPKQARTPQNRTLILACEGSFSWQTTQTKRSIFFSKKMSLFLRFLLLYSRTGNGKWLVVCGRE